MLFLRSPESQEPLELGDDSVLISEKATWLVDKQRGENIVSGG